MKAVVFYDDLCGFCNYWVNWILEKDEKQDFYFAALGSEFTEEFSHHFNFKFPAETVVVWTEETGFLLKSNAVIFLLEVIDPSSFKLKAMKLFPKFLRDLGYSVFAYFRRFFPINSCELPSLEDRRRFLTGTSFQVFISEYKKV